MYIQIPERNNETNVKKKKGINEIKLTPDEKAKEGINKPAAMVPKRIKIAGMSIKKAIVLALTDLLNIYLHI